MKKENLELLEKYGQTHLLRFYEKLDEQKKDALEKQIENLDWGLFSCLDSDSTPSNKGNIAPLGALSVDEIEKRIYADRPGGDPGRESSRPFAGWRPGNPAWLCGS